MLSLKPLEAALDAVLRTEEAADEGLIDDEPESEEPIDAEAAVEAALARLEKQVLQPVASPGNDGDPKSSHIIGDESQDYHHDVQRLVVLIRKAWHLVNVRNRLEAPDVLEITLARLTAARKCIKQKDWELADTRRRLQQLEQERSAQDHRLRQFQTEAERERWERAEAERRVSEFQSEVDADAARTCDELRRRIAATEKKFDDAQEELVLAQSRCEEVRIADEHRATELQAELVESRCCTEALEQRLQKKLTAAKRAEGPRIASSSAISSSSIAALQAATTASIAGAASTVVTHATSELSDPFLTVPTIEQSDVRVNVQCGSPAGGRSTEIRPSGLGAFGDELRNVAERRASRAQRFPRSAQDQAQVGADGGYVPANVPSASLTRKSSSGKVPTNQPSGAKVPTNLRSLSSLLAGGARFGN